MTEIPPSKFIHLHVHSQYSILDGATNINKMIAKAKSLGMGSIALTDHGYMYGSKLFYDLCRKNKIKPILGVEAYVSRESHTQKNLRSGDHLIILAKNKIGYKNLVKLVSISATDGFYYRPRIDKDLLKKYSEGLIISSACIAGEIPRAILDGNDEEAEKIASWYKDVFGEDFYLEIMRHPSSGEHSTEETRDVYVREMKASQSLIKLAKKLNIKVIATNDVHFLDSNDADAHEILLCLNTGKKLSDENRMRYTRHEWFKTYEEMLELFQDFPEALTNTLEIESKVEDYNLDSKPIMPMFPIPQEFGSEEEYKQRFNEALLREEFGDRYNELGTFDEILRIKFEADYLQYLCQQGAKIRYDGNIPADIQERIDFELDTIKTMGFPGYFLIVQDFIAAARAMNVIVGPGRGSAAGSSVAYCLGITGIDPVKYDLLFERFLNPDRISMPDIDIDFDDEGRGRVLDWVTDKYGSDHVAHIITFGSMAPKSAIKDVARVIELPLQEANRLSKLVPTAPKITMEKAFKEEPLLLEEKESNDPQIKKTMELAESLDGSIRQTGIHACGVLISRDPLLETIPVIPTPGENLLTTQYDGHFVEPIGLLKMDFLGLRTLSIIKTCLASLKEIKNINIDINKIPLDDKETFDLFSRGETSALFQFESPGMKKHLRSLKPNRFEDLVAMNALYRPGPMAYIPSFINRKHGSEEIKYDHPLMEKYLNDTYGITVYQEQVMLLSRLLGQFTRGESDTLRKAMGKKMIDVMNKLYDKFKDGCLSNPEFMNYYDGNIEPAEKTISKIWADWTAFASYAFNKSHSVCYAYIAYQTGYLKAHYPIEFMASVLTSELGNAVKLAFLLQECDNIGIKVKPPCVNQSNLSFSPIDTTILFGLAAIRGVGESAAQTIIDARNREGKFTDMIDFCEKTEGKIGKKTIESLIKAGAFDCFGKYRSQMAAVIEDATKIAASNIKEKQSGQTSLFDFFGEGAATKTELSFPNIPEWGDKERLFAEKEYLGVYVTGHPIGEHLALLNNFELHHLDFIDKYKAGIAVRMGGYIAEVNLRKTAPEKGGKEWAIIQLEGLNQRIECLVFPRTYEEFGEFLTLDSVIMVEANLDLQDNNSNDDESTVSKKLIAKKIIPCHKIAEQYTKELYFRLHEDQVNEESLRQITQICQAYPGEIPLTICIICNDCEFAFVQTKIKVCCQDELLGRIRKLFGPDVIYTKSDPTPPEAPKKRNIPRMKPQE